MCSMRSPAVWRRVVSAVCGLGALAAASVLAALSHFTFLVAIVPLAVSGVLAVGLSALPSVFRSSQHPATGSWLGGGEPQPAAGGVSPGTHDEMEIERRRVLVELDDPIWSPRGTLAEHRPPPRPQGPPAPEERWPVPEAAPNGSGVTEAARPSEQRRTGSARRPGPPPPRWILAQIYDVSHANKRRLVRRALRANAPHVLRVQIGPDRSDAFRATGGAPIDDVLPDTGQARLLTLVFMPPSGLPTTRSLSLPARGASEFRSFVFQTDRAGQEVEVEVLVVYKNRCWQRAVLRALVLDDPTKAPADAQIKFTIAALYPGYWADLDQRRSFDSVVVTSHSLSGEHAAWAVHDLQIAVIDPARLSISAKSISQRLEDVANNPDDYPPDLESAKNVELLRDLAFQGVELYQEMGQPIERTLDGEDLSRLQVVVSDPNEFVPIEFVYDLPCPTNTAALCPRWREALATGVCSRSNHPPPDSHDIGLSTVVCPSGFWALSKVIERQMADQRAKRSASQLWSHGDWSDPIDGRVHLTGFNAAVFGASDKVDPNHTGLSTKVLANLQRIVGSETQAVQVDTWAEWLSAVHDLRPSLQLLLSHTTNVRGSLGLEIGSDDVRMLAQINRSVVKPHPDMVPVVLLLGCSTAITDRQLQTFVTAFRNHGAALVVGTVASVLGRRAAPVAEALITALNEASQAGREDDQPCFGDVMRDVRRRLLLNGELMALCLTSFGDADWRLPKPIARHVSR